MEKGKGHAVNVIASRLNGGYWERVPVSVPVNYQAAKKNLKQVIKNPEKYRNPELIAEFLNNVVERAYPVNS